MDNLNMAEKQVLAKQSEWWKSGLTMIGVGLIFLIWQLTNLHNWWAMFMLIPVAATWGKGVNQMRLSGRVTREAAQAFASSLFPIFIALIFLLNWSWGTAWPGFIVIAGLNALIGGWFD